MSVSIAVLLLLTLQLPANTVCANAPFHVEATAVANNSSYVATGYTLYVAGSAQTTVPVSSVANGIVSIDHQGLPVGTHRITMSVKYQAISSATSPQTGETIAPEIVGTFIDCTTPPPTPAPKAPFNPRFNLPTLPGQGVVPAIVNSFTGGSGGGSLASVDVPVSAGQFIIVGVAQTSSSLRTYNVTDNTGETYTQTSALGNGRRAIIATTARPAATAGSVAVTVRADAAATFSVRVFVVTANGVDSTGSSVVGATGTNTLVPCAQPGVVYAQPGFALCLGVVTTTAGMTPVAGTTALFTTSNVSWYRKDGAQGTTVDLAYRRGTCTSCIGMAASVKIW